MTDPDRIASYDAFAQKYLQAVREYAASRPNQRSKAPWQSLVDTGLRTLQDIPASEFAPKAYWILKAYPELERLLIEVTDFLPDDAKLVERQYCVYFGLTSRPDCGACGKQLTPNPKRFRFVGTANGTIKAGYGRYCNVKCASSAEETVAKRRATNLARHGVDVPAKSADVVAKMQSTTEERYGSKSYAATEAYKELMQEKFGGSTPFAKPAVQDKARKVVMEKYGVTNIMEVQSSADKAGDGKRRHAYARLSTPERVGEVEPLFTVDEYHGVMKRREIGLPWRYPWRCKVCATEFVDSLESSYSAEGGKKPRCPQCYPAVVSMGEAALRMVVDGARDGAEMLVGDRMILDGQEVDILLPSMKVAIEYNGLYWHSERAGKKDRHYHQSKLEKLNALGYRLIYVWEDEWHQQPEAVTRMVIEACGAGRTVDLDQCTVVSGEDFKEYVTDYHREGPLGGVVTTYALVTADKEVAAVLQVAQRAGKNGKQGTSAIRYTGVNGFKVPEGLAHLMSVALSRTKGAKLFHVELDPTFDDVSVYRRAGFVMAKERGEQQWYTMRPYRYGSRRTRKELLAHAAESGLVLKADSPLSISRLQSVSADRIWGVRRQVWEYQHTPE